MSRLVGLVSGLIFGIGLILGGMTDPMKVKAFLDIGGAWDPSLAFVMGGGVAVAAAAFAVARRRQRAWTGASMEIPTSRVIDLRLIGGGLLFGVGWGIGGFCPGPALVALGSGMGEAAVFTVAMVAGMWLHDRVVAR